MHQDDSVSICPSKHYKMIPIQATEDSYGKLKHNLQIWKLFTDFDLQDLQFIFSSWGTHKIISETYVWTKLTRNT